MDLESIGTPKKIVNALKKKGVHTVTDFLEWGPRKYHFFGYPAPLNTCIPEKYTAVKATLLFVNKKFFKDRPKPYLVFRFNADGREFNVLLFERVFEYDKFLKMVNKEIVICGRFNMNEYGPTFDSVVDFYLADEYQPHIYPVYSNIKGVAEGTLNDLRNRLYEMQGEVVERDIRQSTGLDLLTYQMALYKLHNPKTYDDITKAKERLNFNDLLYFNLSLKSNAVEAPVTTTKVFSKWTKTQEFIKSLPFALTTGDGSQSSVLNEIFVKAKKGDRVNMLVQGDVGCGKTIVAAALMMFAAENGYQSILMAPRDVLAKQHYEEIAGYAEKMGFTCAFLGGGLKAKEKRDILSDIKAGKIDFIVGTHACIGEKVVYANLGAVITDEEHLFGVDQKNALVEKAQDGVHSLSMSATPIPRTMASVMYGQQKEMRIISQKPAGRLPIITTGEQKRDRVFSRMEEQIKEGHQCYVVCPAIEDNDKSDLVSLEYIEAIYKEYFEPKGIQITIVNGKLKKEEVEENIGKFISNECQILLSTTVIEVGVNVPNSTVMVIEQADRFGLATLHQLRGRVGRNSLQSYCVLLCEDEQNARVQVMCETNDGFKIAEADLEQRGTGDLIGTAQSGENVYIEKMLNYPDLFAKAERAADLCVKEKKGHFLTMKYQEHLSYDMEKKKRKTKE